MPHVRYARCLQGGDAIGITAVVSEMGKLVLKAVAVIVVLYLALRADILPLGDGPKAEGAVLEIKEATSQSSKLTRTEVVSEYGSAQAYSVVCGFHFRNDIASHVLVEARVLPSEIEEGGALREHFQKGVERIAALKHSADGNSTKMEQICLLGMTGYGPSGTIIPYLLAS